MRNIDIGLAVHDRGCNTHVTCENSFSHDEKEEGSGDNLCSLWLLISEKLFLIHKIPRII